MFSKVVLLSAVHQSESAVCILVSPPSTWHQAELPVLCSSFPLGSYFTHGSIYMSVPISQFIPPTPAPYPHICSLHLRLYSCPVSRFICAVFLDFAYALITIFVFLFLTYLSLYGRLHLVLILSLHCLLQVSIFYQLDLWLNLCGGLDSSPLRCPEPENIPPDRAKGIVMCD